MIIQPSRRSGGITLIEMMVVVLIVAILAALVTPSLSELFIKNRLETASNEFTAALSLARSEAIRRGVNVAVRRAGPTPRDWTQGWEVYVERDSWGAVGYCQRSTAAGSGEDLIQVGQPLAARLSLRSTWYMRNCVVFWPNGRSDVPEIGLSPADEVFVLCHGDVISENGRSRSRAIVISNVGRIRLGADSNGDGFVETDGGQSVNSCTPV